MLKLIRRVEFPQGLQTSGPVIKAALLQHVKHHQELIENAQAQASDLLTQAQMESEQIKEETKEQTAQALKNDLMQIKKLTASKEKALHDKAASVCIDICSTVLEELFQNSPESEKIRILVQSLLNRTHHARELKIKTAPDQNLIVEEMIAQVMAQQMNLKKWSVTADKELKPYEIRISTSNGSEIRVSLENLLALYKEEITALGDDIHPLMQHTEAGNESIS